MNYISKKALVTISAVLLYQNQIFSQTVNGNLITELDTQYLKVELNPAEFFSSKLTMIVDAGQDRKLFVNTFVKDKNGQKMLFNSFVDAANFLYKNGFDYYDARTIRNENPMNDSQIYTFKKSSSK
jgi:hypothetical protein